MNFFHVSSNHLIKSSTVTLHQWLQVFILHCGLASLQCTIVTLDMLSKTILVGVTGESENEPMTNTAIWFTRRISVLLSEVHLLTRLENHISKMLQTLQLLMSAVYGVFRETVMEC